MRRIPALVWLLVVWLAMWGEVSVGNVASGVLLAVGIQAVFPAAAPRPAGSIRPLRALRYLAYLGYKLGEANLVVAWEVLTPGMGINLGVVAVPIHGASDAVVTVVANSISLTPGTLTLEVSRDPAVLYVHVLHVRSVEATREEIWYLEYLALRAFAPELVGDLDWEAWCREAPWHTAADSTTEGGEG